MSSDGKINKKIYIEPTAKMHSAFRELVRHPPEGYEFVTAQRFWDKVTEQLTANHSIYSSVSGLMAKLVPPHLVISHLGKFNRKPQGSDLTFSCGHLVFRKEPWVIELEWVIQLTSFSMRSLEKHKRLIERVLASDYCKKIICMTELTKKTILWHLACDEFEHKLETVYRVVHPKDFVKKHNNDRIKLFFAGSANFPKEFEDEKGGKEVLEVFALLGQKYSNLELVIRSDVPKNIKDRCAQAGNIRIIDEVIPWEELEQEFRTADIFLLPAHHTPSMAFLDAMSYELPVVTIDSWANSEIVEDGKTGFVVGQPDRFQLPVGDFLPDRRATPVKRGTRVVNQQTVEELADKTSLLIENPELRRQMGKAGRWEVEQGKFSIMRRNEKLKRILDEATARG